MRDAFLEAVAVNGEFLVIHAQLMQDGGVPVLNTHAIAYGAVPDVIGFAVHHAAFHSAASHPAGKTTGTMIAPGLGVIALSHWQATEFAAPKHEHIIEQPALTQVTQ